MSADNGGTAEQPDLGLDQFESAPDDHGLSIDQLSTAYAQLMGRGDVPFERRGGRLELGAEAKAPACSHSA